MSGRLLRFDFYGRPALWYLHRKTKGTNVDLVDAIQSWRSVRDFSTEKVDRSEIADLIELAIQVSTPPQNETPWQICVLEGADRIAALGERALEYARTHQPEGRPPWKWVDIPNFRVFLGAPAVVVISAQIGNDDAPFDCHRAGQNLVLAAHTRGFGSCWLGAPMPWLTSLGVKEELGVSSEFEPAVTIALGRPATYPEAKARPRPDIIWSMDQ